MIDQIPIIIVTSPEGRQTFLTIPIIIVTSPEGRQIPNSPEISKSPVYHRPKPLPMTLEEREIIFAGTQPVPPRSILREIFVRLGDILCL
jgi:hypothetical protein